MLNGRQRNLAHLIEGVYRDYGFDDSQVDWNDVIEWVAEVISLIGVPDAYEEKTALVTIEDYRGDLPCDLYEVHLGGVRDPYTGQVYNHATDTYFRSSTKPLMVSNSNSAYTYKFQGNYIHTSLETGTLEIAYRAFAVDEDGFPLLPDDVSYIMAVKNHVAYKIVFRQKMKGIATMDDLRLVERERNWYIGQATTRGLIPSLDKMLAFKNQWVRMVQQNNQSSGNLYAGEPEKLYN